MNFEDQIRADPYNYELWAVYGDHLMEMGDIRGELIALDLAKIMGEKFCELRRDKVEADYVRSLNLQQSNDIHISGREKRSIKFKLGCIESFHYSDQHNRDALFRFMRMFKKMKNLFLIPFSITIESSFLTDINIEWIVKNKFMEKVKKIQIIQLNKSRNHINPLTQKSAISISSSPHMKNLEVLSILNISTQHTKPIMSTEALTALSSSPYMKNLRMLSMSSINDKTFETLSSRNTHMKKLEYISNNKLISINGDIMRAEKIGRSVGYLSDISDKGLICLSKSQIKLKEINLEFRGHNITDAGVVPFASSPAMKYVEYLCLTNTKISDESIVAIANSQYSTNLRNMMVVAGNNITSTSKHAVLSSPYLHESIKQQWK